MDRAREARARLTAASFDPKVYRLETYELRGAELALTGTFGPESSPAPAPFEAARFGLADLWT